MKNFRTKAVQAAFLSLTLSACGQASLPDADVTSVLIENVLLADGTGSPMRRGALRIDQGLIAELGDLQPLEGETVHDGGGHVLAPGFIDTHSHASAHLFEERPALAAVSQGITTVIIGQDGSSPLPLLDFRMQLLEQPSAINVAAFSGHNSLRRRVMGEDFRRPATEPEIRVMAQLLREDLEAGALGLSAGLEYDPGIYSDTGEVIELARVAAGFGGRYVSHIRSEDRYFSDAIEEIITIGREAGLPVQISHFKLAMTSLWGRADEFLARLDRARAEGVDITADIYPYEYWQSNMMVLLPERDPTDLAAIEFALNEIAPPDGMWFSEFEPDPSLVSRTLADVAAERNQPPAETFQSLLLASMAMSEETGEGVDGIIATSMREEDIHALLSWPHTNVCSDGYLIDRHPRGAGSFARVLGRYVREQELMRLETAIHKMTGMAASHMGIDDRGILRPGAAADLVLFDPDTIIDRATPDDPDELSEGVIKVWVNGIPVYLDGQASGLHPGRFIARSN